jgi:hypothetical protein
VRNLASILAAGVVVSWWLLSFTDSFEAVGSLLALGGLFSWLAFVSKALPEDRMKSLQRFIDERVLGYPKTWKLVLGGLGALVLLSSFLGTLQVEPAPGHSDDAVRVFRKELPKVEDAERLPANGRLRMLCWAPWSSSELHIKVEGLPTGGFRVRPWWWTWKPEKVRVPESMARPVVLLLGSIYVVSEGSGEDLQLVITLNGRRAGPDGYEYTGKALWLGCDDEDVSVPPSVQERGEWKALAAKGELAAKVWPAAALPEVPPLTPGQTLRAELHGVNGVWARAEISIHKPSPGPLFVQTAVLEYVPVKK